MSQPNKDALDALLEAQALAALNVHVIDAQLTTLDVEVTVVRTASATDAEAEAGVVAALNTFLDPEVWPYTPVVYWAELISVIDQAAGVARVASLTEPAADVTLLGVAPLVKLGAATVTVEAP